VGLLGGAAPARRHPLSSDQQQLLGVDDGHESLPLVWRFGTDAAFPARTGGAAGDDARAFPGTRVRRTSASFV
jgi:hypothetical protein